MKLASNPYLRLVLPWLAYTAAATSQTTGCSRKHTDKGALRLDRLTTSDGHPREFLIYIPLTYTENTPQPMLLSFHGNGKDMTSQATLSRFTEPAINPNMIAVFPNGNMRAGHTERSWQGAPYCKGASHNDTLFVSDLLDHMREEYCVDVGRIYATGKSIGGGLVDLLACTTVPGGDFAAFGMDASAMYEEADDVDPPYECTAARPSTPILELHGTDDCIATYNGAVSHTHTLPNIRTVLNKWASRNGCPGETPEPTIDELVFDDQVYYTRYDCAGAEGVVVGYNVTGQGHWWISTEENDENKNVTAPIDASTIMMEFFSRNAKLDICRNDCELVLEL